MKWFIRKIKMNLKEPDRFRLYKKPAIRCSYIHNYLDPVLSQCSKKAIDGLKLKEDIYVMVCVDHIAHSDFLELSILP